MANLDDFFKKKDGKKTKGKKFAVSNPSSLSATENVKNGKVKQEKPTSFVLNNSLLGNENDLFSSQTTDEWKDFVEEKKDYSGLKIQNLHINDNDIEKPSARERDSEEETEIDDNGQTVVKKKQPSGPWKKIQEKKEEPKPVKEEEEEKKEEPKAPEPVKNAYVPPHQRNIGFDRNPNPPRKNTSVPTKEQFPTLGSTVPSSSTQGKKSNKTNG